MIQKKFAIIMIALLWVGQCAAETALSVQLYFGMNLHNGFQVSNTQWREFVETEITPRFPGFTIIDTMGYYKGNADPTKVVVIAMPESQLKDARAIAARYAQLYQQESVMLATTPLTNWEFVPARVLKSVTK